LYVSPPCQHRASCSRLKNYPLGPDSERHADVPKGAVTKYALTSKIFPGTVRDCWVYVPSQYKPDKPACVMIFQDGAGYVQTLYVTAGDKVFAATRRERVCCHGRR
jgi:enterochelin esterase-like enzyme